MLRVVWRLAGRRRRVDRLLTSFLTYRRYLPEVSPERVIPRFYESEIRIKRCPVGPWSTPLVDVITLLKAAVGFESKRILELGSYRGETARLLAENTAPDTTICAVDVDARHGAAYRGLEIEKKIDRRVGTIHRGLFGPHETFDFIFVDADHDFRSVMNDTEVAFGVLAPAGVIMWHDYSNETYFSGFCGVPEVLNEFAQTRSICAIRSTWLAVFSNVPGWQTSSVQAKNADLARRSAWEEETFRG